MSLKINVSYSEKDVAKSRGALWNKDHKSWYVPDYRDINDFLQWIDLEHISIVVKSPIFIAKSSRSCYRCFECTPVIALASLKFMALDDSNEDGYSFYETGYFSFFSMPTYVDPDFQTLLKEHFPYFKQGYSRTVGGMYWANHCINCGALQGDFHMHFEPGAEFWPIDVEGCKLITLISIDTDFDIRLNADQSFHSNEKEIFHYAKKIGIFDYLQQDCKVNLHGNTSAAIAIEPDIKQNRFTKAIGVFIKMFVK